MVFSSLLFLFRFLPLFLALYFLVPRKLRNGVLFIGSLIFYGWGEPVYISLLLFSTLVDFFHGKLVGRFLERGNRKAARMTVASSAFINLALLVIFKYTDFFIRSINSLTGSGIPLLGLALPIGISFYTFQTMSYTIDVYLGQAGAQKSLVQFGAYVAMFPQLVAGPIVKYKDISGQLADRNVTAERFSYGISRFITGLSKKVLLANNIGMVWEQISGGNLAVLSAAEAWIGAAAFSFQIYFDFSGYSDMAIGLGELFGFHFQENFNYPYRSKSMTEFWRRWHISLGTWFREYVYIPLGGSRKGMKRQLLNLLIVWCLTGLWHGASWNFLVWGLYFGVFLTAEKLFLLRRLEALPGWVSHAYCLIFVAVSWVIFAFDSMADVCTYVKSMFGLGSGGWIGEAALYYGETWGVFFVVCALCSLGIFKMKRAFLPVLFAASICFLAGGTYNPFLYFRF